MPTDQPISRRSALQAALAAGGAAVLPGAALAAKADDRRASPKRYDMKKSINLWAFPYPQRVTLKECLQLARDAGFDGIELNYDLDNDLSPKSGPKEYAAIRKTAEDIGSPSAACARSCSGRTRSPTTTPPSASAAWSWRRR